MSAVIPALGNDEIHVDRHDDAGTIIRVLLVGRYGQGAAVYLSPAQVAELQSALTEVTR